MKLNFTKRFFKIKKSIKSFQKITVIVLLMS